MQDIATPEVTTPSDREITITRLFDARRPLVWEAWTNPRHVTHWMLGPPGWSMPVCEIDLRPGGGWHFVWRRADGSELEMRGAYREVTPPLRLVHTETWGGDWPETVNTLVLDDLGEQTRVSLTILYPSKQDRDAALGTGMKDGIAVSYDRLDALLRTLVQASATECAT